MRISALLLGVALICLCIPVHAQDVTAGESQPPPENDVKAAPEATGEPDLNTVSEDDLYMSAFGTKKPDYGEARYPVMVDGVMVGDAAIDPREDGWVERKIIEESVLPFLIPEEAERLRAALTSDKTSFSSLRSLSYDVSFNRRDLILSIAVPMELRTERAIRLNRSSRTNVIDTIKPADFSGYLSVRAGADWIQAGPDASGSPSGIVADFDAAINVKGVTLEGSFRYNQDGSRKWTRDDVRLVYDDTSSLVRYELGDLSVGRRPDQNAPRMAGISAYREFRINPYEDPRPSGERGLVLDRPARVEVRVNGASIRHIDLPAGRYSINDFPIMPGATNDVEFIVTYASGEVEVISFPAFTDIDLLDKGLSEFAINVGVPYKDDLGVRRYDTGEFNLMGYYRRGLSSTLTVGGTLEASSEIAVAGPQVTWASPIGSFDLSMVTDFMDPGPDTSRLALRHSWRSTDPRTGMSLDSFVILTGKKYRTLDRLFDSNISTIYAQSRLSMAIGPETRVQVGGSYEKSTEPRIGERWTAGLSASHRLGRISLIGGVDWKKDDRGSDVGARISMFIPLGKATVTSSFATRDSVFRTEYRKPSGNGVGSFGYSAGVEVRDGANRQFARANYVGNRFEAAIDQERFDGRGPADIRSGFAFGTALVMADGHFAITRPVSDSFAIISNASTIDSKIAVEPRSRSGGKVRYSGWSDFIGPAVVPDLPSYLRRDLEVVAPDAPAGAGLGGEVFTVQPRYKSGYFMKTGAGNGSVSALGNLVDADGKPLGLVSGVVRKAGNTVTEDDDKNGASFFTNSAGRFFVEGLEPGVAYEAVMTVDDKVVRFKLDPPQDAIGIWRIEQPVTVDIRRGEE